MRKIQSASAYVFIFAVVILTIISILGVWDILGSDVLFKSLQTFGLLAIVSIIVMVAGKFISRNDLQEMIIVPDPMFKVIRQTTVTTLIASCSILALLGVLTIWDVITDKSVLYRALGSLGILAFSSFIIILISLSQEKANDPKKSTNISVGLIIAIIFVALLLAQSLFR